MPVPVPVMVLGPLAVDRAFQGRISAGDFCAMPFCELRRLRKSAAFGRSWFTRFPNLRSASTRATDSSLRQSIRSRS